MEFSHLCENPLLDLTDTHSGQAKILTDAFLLLWTFFRSQNDAVVRIWIVEPLSALTLFAMQIIALVHFEANVTSDYWKVFPFHYSHIIHASTTVCIH